MQKYHDTAQDDKGNGLTTASIYVYLTETGALAAIKKDDEITPLSNPITSADTDNYDNYGNFGFKAASGTYDVKIVIGTSEAWRPEVKLFDSDTDLGELASLDTAPIVNGGTGQVTAQAAIDALSQVSGATNEHVLTKDTVSGNAVWKDSTGGTDASTTVKGIVELATDAEVAAGTDTTRVPPVSSLGSHITACKAWVNFNGVGTVSIRDSYNVSSITDNGAGKYTVNFTNNMTDTNFAALLTTGMDSAYGINYVITGREYSDSRTVSSVTFWTNNILNTAAPVAVDVDYVSVLIFGG